MTTRADGTCARMRRVASTASSARISKPIKTTSGRSEVASSTASLPSCAQPMMSKPSSALSVFIRSRASRRSPSARRTRIAPVGGPLAIICGNKDAAPRASCEEAPNSAEPICRNGSRARTPPPPPAYWTVGVFEGAAALRIPEYLEERVPTPQALPPIKPRVSGATGGLLDE
jgi:hypothetical protein